MPTTVNVTVERILYPAATVKDANWYLLKTNHGIAVGTLAWRPQEHEALILEGEWGARNGERQFKFTSARIDIPVAPRDQLHYCVVRTLGMGPALESMIWERFGDNWRNIKPGDIARLSGRAYEEFQRQIEAMAGKSEEAGVIATLMGKGCTTNMAYAAWTLWKGGTMGVVNADCYRLSELSGYSFKDVDTKIRKNYDIKDDDKRRIRAAVIYSLRKLTDAGDTVVLWENLFKQAVGMLGGYAEMVSECTSELFEEGALKGFAESGSVSLAQDWKAESAIWDFVQTHKEVRK
jgi:hypothetical protein